jgi:hypothetical protein
VISYTAASASAPSPYGSLAETAVLAGLGRARVAMRASGEDTPR